MRTTIFIPGLAAALAGTAILTSSAAIAGSEKTVSVSGSGIDIASEAIIHSELTTPTGMIRMLTEIVELTGDVNGKVLYQATQEFDFAANTLVVTGENVFSGTIAGSDPVILRSDESRFEVDLATGEETGGAPHSQQRCPGQGILVRLRPPGRRNRPDTGGKPTFDYSGTCTRKGR